MLKLTKFDLWLPSAFDWMSAERFGTGVSVCVSIALGTLTAQFPWGKRDGFVRAVAQWLHFAALNAGAANEDRTLAWSHASAERIADYCASDLLN